MCMYSAIARALAPVSIFWPAMFSVGHCLTAEAMPAFCASALIADGVMSDPATMYSCERLLLTVWRPFTPITMATTPNATSTAAATNPPISSDLRISRLLSNRDPFRAVSDAAPPTPSGLRRKSPAEKPLRGGEDFARPVTGCDRPRDVERRDDADGTARIRVGDREVGDPILRHQAAGLADRTVGRDGDERRHRRGARG